ncbi:hypothetical protein H7I53_21235 [Mycolicibacterium pulveris]|uniref:Acyl-CoA synthase n=1 Tax=Mycolicibacterium pulveris TaxID=36813 RepID=A0A7I7UHK0_MYCPV|nr:hypothetical protein [Mycolicibacterium pulveris]MCV6982737.1 hypothetical protein [Mycolicibacterium pulveris]BBY80333.1 hypothetical protein MPUL_14910 [Mycolicibacterium pulveris]
MTEPRPDTADYDLLTFGEVAARLSEELAAATAELDGLRQQASPDTDRIRRLEQRIELLKSSGDRYRQEQRTNESFNRRFGSLVDPPSDRRPQWR